MADVLSHTHTLSTSEVPRHSQSMITLRPKIHNGTWVATLSNGETIVERQGDFDYKQGEPSPWVRLTYFLGDNDLHLTSLRLNFDGRTVHMPRPKFDKFGLETRSPSHYSLQYHLEAEGEFGGMEQTIYMDLVAHYDDDYAVHYIQDVTGGNDSWVAITDSKAQAATPRTR